MAMGWLVLAHPPCRAGHASAAQSRRRVAANAIETCPACAQHITYIASGVPTNRRGALTTATLGQRQSSGYPRALRLAMALAWRRRGGVRPPGRTKCPLHQYPRPAVEGSSPIWRGHTRRYRSASRAKSVKSGVQARAAASWLACSGTDLRWSQQRWSAVLPRAAPVAVDCRICDCCPVLEPTSG
jgi:hypothetical protein